MSWIYTAIVRLIKRREQRWVEVSLERAWSHDVMPRLFDLE